MIKKPRASTLMHSNGCIWICSCLEICLPAIEMYGTLVLSVLCPFKQTRHKLVCVFPFHSIVSDILGPRQRNWPLCAVIVFWAQNLSKRPCSQLKQRKLNNRRQENTCMKCSQKPVPRKCDRPGLKSEKFTDKVRSGSRKVWYFTTPWFG